MGFHGIMELYYDFDGIIMGNINNHREYYGIIMGFDKNTIVFGVVMGFNGSKDGNGILM